MQAIRALAGDLHRGGGGDRQLDLAAEARVLAATEGRDRVDRLVAREAGRLRVPAAAGCSRDLGDVELVDRGAQRDAVGWAVGARRLADQHSELGSLDRTQVVDDSLR